MLILTRRVGETLMVGDDITVTVLGVKGNQVRIGVNARKKSRYTVKKSTSGFSRKKALKSPSPATAESQKAVQGKPERLF